MRNNLTPLRPGLTAIAAVLALSATPVFAQSAETAPSQDAPVISAPAPITTTPASDAAPAPAQQSVTTENISASLTAPAAPMATQSPVVIHTADAADAKAPAAPKRAPAPVTHTATVAPVASAKVAPDPVAKVATPAPAAMPGLAPVATAPVATKSTTTATSAGSDNTRELELAGIGAVGLLALIGGAVAVTRRKRDDEEEGAVLAPTATTTIPVEPAIDTAPVAVAPMMDDAPATALHEEFDLSRYGAHVQTAYHGPTEDNPSLSLRHRLKRARFMDQRAREAGAYSMAPDLAMPAERKPIAQNLIGARLKQGLQAMRPRTGGLRPAFG